LDPAQRARHDHEDPAQDHLRRGLQQLHRLGQHRPVRRRLRPHGPGGITASQTVNFTSSGTATSPKLVHMIVPVQRVSTVPCTAPSVTVGNSFGSDEKVTLLWYSPCDIVYGNSGASFGGVYSGSTLSSGNAFTLTYRPVTVYGISAGTGIPTSYKVDVVYKREDRL
jgi:hypothetical protein